MSGFCLSCFFRDCFFLVSNIFNFAALGFLVGILFGGPVNLEMGLILHDANYIIDGTLTISKSVALTSNKQIVLDLKNGDGPDEFRFSFGYTGWGKGHIEREIENGDWLLMPADDEFIFSIPNTDKWQKAALKFGIDILDLGGSAGLA